MPDRRAHRRGEDRRVERRLPRSDILLEARVVRIEGNADLGIALFFGGREGCGRDDEAGIGAR